MTLNQLRTLALSFPEATEEPHFEKTSFRVKKKIFVTFDEKLNRCTIKLSQIDQDAFSIAAKQVIYPVPNKWGKQGWTIIEMSQVNPELFNDALITAYCEVAPPKFVQLVRSNIPGA